MNEAQEKTSEKPTKIQLLEKKIADQKARLAKLEFERRRAEAAASQKARKADTRRKILIGSMLLPEIELGSEFGEMLRAKLGGYLTRDDDRALFGLAPNVAPPAPVALDDLEAASETLQ